VECTGESRSVYTVLVGDSEGKISHRTILKWILKPYNWMTWTEFSWVRIGTSVRIT